MLREIRFVEAAHQLLEILVGEEISCLSVVLELSDLFHGIPPDNHLHVEPVEEDPQIPNVVVDRRDADGLPEVPPPLWMVDTPRSVIAIERILPSLLEIIDVSADGRLRHLVHIFDGELFPAPAFKEPQRLFV